MRGVEPWLWVLPAATLSLPFLLGAFAWLNGVAEGPAPGPRATGMLPEVFLLAVLCAPVVGLFVLVYVVVLLFRRRVAARSLSTVAALALAVLCVAQPLTLILLMLLTHGLTR